MVITKKEIKKKVIFLGEINSINLEIIINSFNFLKNKSKYFIIGSLPKIELYLAKIKNNLNSNIKLNPINDPLNFNQLERNKLNIFDVTISENKFKELQKQIYLSNFISNLTKIDLITMPIDKSIFKSKMIFTGMTEYLGKINKCETLMLMKGEKFSIIPITTHITLDRAYNTISNSSLKKFFNIFETIKNNYMLPSECQKFKFLCINPHCGENGLMSKKDINIKKVLSSLNFKVDGPIPADSAFNKEYENTLYFSTYHDQALIPFKILNKKSFNETIGLSYRRLSPSHGTATNILYKNISDNSSYIECMTI